MIVIPAIDLMEGRAVRLEQGRAETAKIYSSTPWELARAFAAAGARRLHVVDLDAAFTGAKKHNRATIAKIIGAAPLEVEVGGGVRSLEDCQALFELGARYAVLGTVAVEAPDVLARACALYPGRIIVAVDARDGKVAVRGWTENSDASALDLGRQVAEAGAAAVLYTDIARDGMRTGPNFEATRRLAEAIAPCPVIASGGISRLEDLDGTIGTGAGFVVIGKAIYEGAFTVAEALARVGGTAK